MKDKRGTPEENMGTDACRNSLDSTWQMLTKRDPTSDLQSEVCWGYQALVFDQSF